MKTRELDLCLICNSKNIPTKTTKNRVDALSKQLNVIFIVKYLLKLPNSQLTQFLQKYGNPVNWISLCKQCAQLTGQAQKLHLQMLQISSQLKGIKKELVEKIKLPVNYQLTKTKQKDNFKIIIWKDVKEFVKNDNPCNPPPSPGHPEEPKLTRTPTIIAETTLHPPNLSSIQLNIENDDLQCCPNCAIKFPTQQIHYPDTNSEDDPIKPSSCFIGDPQNCLYCSIQYPSLSSLLKHMQTEHGVDRLPCLHPGCGATLKNIKQYFKHRQIHKRKEEAEQLNLTGEIDDLQDSIQSEPHESKITIEEFNEDEEQALEHNDDLQDNHSDAKDDLQDNHNDNDDHHQDSQKDDENLPQDNYIDNDDLQDNDWSPSCQAEEIDIKPAIKIDKDDKCPDPSENPNEEDESQQEATSDNPKVHYQPKKVFKAEVQKCPKCSAKFPSITSTLKHMSTFHKMTRLPCLHSGCQQTLKNLKQYFKHRSKHLRPPEPKKPNKPRVPKVKVVGPKLCDICGASFSSTSGLYSHRNCVHGDKKRKRIYRDATCHVCGIVLKGCHLKMHMLRKHKNECGEEFKGEFFKCGVMGCKRYFIQKDRLDKHVDKMHDGWDGNGESPPTNKKKWKFECKFCGKGYFWKGKLEQHEQAHQNNLEGKKPFICEICGKGFGMPLNLDNHKKYTHKLAKKFQNVNGEGTMK